MITALVLLLFPGQLPTLESEHFSREAQTAALIATVRVINSSQGFDGGGAVIGRNGPVVYILTAEHVVRDTRRVEIHSFSSESYPKPAGVYKSGEVIARSRSSVADLALVRLATTEMLPGSLSLCPARSVPQRVPFPVLTVGCNDGHPTCEIAKVERAFQVEKIGQTGKALFWRTASRPVKGRSGGPLLDRQGKLLGICSLADENVGYYSHIDEISLFLREAGFRWLIPPAE